MKKQLLLALLLCLIPLVSGARLNSAGAGDAASAEVCRAGLPAARCESAVVRGLETTGADPMRFI